MKKWAIALFAVGAFNVPASAQKKQAAAPVDVCSPIGKTSDGRFVYSLKCDVIPTPVPPPPAPAASIAPPPPPEEEDKGGLFRNPFPSIIRPTNVQRSPGVGPAGAGP